MVAWRVDWRGEVIENWRWAWLRDFMVSYTCFILPYYFSTDSYFYTLLQFLKTAYKIGLDLGLGLDLAPACLQGLVRPFLSRVQPGGMVFHFTHVTNSFLSQSFYTSGASFLNCSFPPPLHGQLWFFKLKLGITALRDLFSIVPSLKAHRRECKTYPRSSHFTSPLSLLLCARPSRSRNNSSCLLMITLLHQESFWMAHVLSKYFWINEHGCQSRGYTQLLPSTSWLWSLYMWDRGGEKRKVLIWLILHHVFISVDGVIKVTGCEAYSAGVTVI